MVPACRSGQFGMLIEFSDVGKATKLQERAYTD